MDTENNNEKENVNKINNSSNSSKKKEYLAKWKQENNQKIKQINANYYQKIKDDELFKQKKQEYNKQYYNKKKQLKNQLESSKQEQVMAET